MFSHFSRTPTCDTQTDRWTDRQALDDSKYRTSWRVKTTYKENSNSATPVKWTSLEHLNNVSSKDQKLQPLKLLNIIFQTKKK